MNPFITDMAILCVVTGLGYIATAIAYGMGYKEGKEDGARLQWAKMVREGYVKPPM